MEKKEIQKTIIFANVRDKIIDKLETKIDSLKIPEPVTLLDGFVNQPFSMELSNSIIIGGPTIPIIMLLGDESGRLYFFALKAILSDEELASL